jgi:predicted RNA-binding Zn ribbon-like protein
MTAFPWHDHHFINRNPALDFANMVVWRSRADRREDRGQSSENLKGWAVHAGLAAPRSGIAQCVQVREAIDRYFRARQGWSELVTLYARSVATDRDPFLQAILHAAMALAFSDEMKRVRVCGNCGWLFIDRTRNANKRWCTANLCGSRTRARRYYARRRQLSSPSRPASNT